MSIPDTPHCPKKKNLQGFGMLINIDDGKKKEKGVRGGPGQSSGQGFMSNTLSCRPVLLEIESYPNLRNVYKEMKVDMIYIVIPKQLKKWILRNGKLIGSAKAHLPLPPSSSGSFLGAA